MLLSRVTYSFLLFCKAADMFDSDKFDVIESLPLTPDKRQKFWHLDLVDLCQVCCC
jgi:hypothetical protein